MQQAARSLCDTFDRESPIATEFRRLYVRARRLAGDGGMRTVLVTSARRGEGKTTAAAHLALTAALHGDRAVALIDMDLRRPRVHALFGVPQGPGVAEVLKGRVPAVAAIQDTAVANLKVMTSGRVSGPPAGLLEGGMTGVLLEELRARFDFVVLDAPPVIPVTDPMVIAPRVDATLLVVMAGETPRAVVQRARSVIQDCGARLLGVVVNNLDEVLPYYYDYQYYGYQTEQEDGEAGADKESR